MPNWASTETAAPAGTRSRAPVASNLPATAADIDARARLIVLGEGLYALGLGGMTHGANAAAGVALPAVHVSAPPSDDYDLVEIATSSGELANWFGAESGAVVVKSPPGGGVVMLTVYGPAEAAAALTVDVRRLDAPHGAVPPPAATRREPPRPAPAAATREIRSEIVLHIEREGDRRFAAQGWAGNRGRRLRVEAFSIRPLEELLPGDIEYKAFGPDGRETPWVSDAKLCGTRGRGLPLTGFAARLAPHLRDRFDIVYEGAFFDSGVSGPHRDGEPCLPTVSDDPLEAINLRVIERGAG